MHSTLKKNISAGNDAGTPAMANIKVLIAAGGTGGHVYPAIAIADALRKKQEDIDILFAGTKDHMEWDAVPKAGYDITSIWISGFHRRLTPKNLLFPLKLGTSLIQSLNIINSFDPDVVISCGGYVAGPVGWVAAQKGVPLVIQEQNSYPGLTNRLLGKSAERVFTAFRDANRYFPEEKTELTGNPTRESLTTADLTEAYGKFDFTKDKKTLLVLGGSGGARSINNAMKEHVEKLHNQLGLQIIWQCGKRYFDQLRRDLESTDYENLVLTDFLHDMPKAYAVADLVISRAGALSCSELALTGTPSILVPSPNVAGDHQTKNAVSMAQKRAAKVIPDNELENKLDEVIEQLISDEEQLEAMGKAAIKLGRPEAAETIADEILTLIKDYKTKT